MTTTARTGAWRLWHGAVAAAVVVLLILGLDRWRWAVAPGLSGSGVDAVSTGDSIP